MVSFRGLQSSRFKDALKTVKMLFTVKSGSVKSQFLWILGYQNCSDLDVNQFWKLNNPYVTNFDLKILTFQAISPHLRVPILIFN